MDGAKYTFTVFTPTYNRAHTLHRVYDSLRAQTFRDFEWLIIDDGSTDRTRDIVSQWGDTSFPLRYLFQENAGKHVAFNRGVREARGELFLNIDSDDSLVPQALERFKFHWDAIPAEAKSQFSAVTALCMDQRGQVVGERFPSDVVDSNSLDLYFTLNIAGEKCGFHRTSVLRCHPFPEPEGVKFVPESLVWFAIARRYRTRFVNECLRIYHQADADAEPRLTALTRTTALGRALFHKAVLNEYVDYLGSSPSRMAKSLVNYCRYSFLCGVPLVAQLGELHSPRYKAAATLAAPFGYVLSLRDARRMRGDHWPARGSTT